MDCLSYHTEPSVSNFAHADRITCCSSLCHPVYMYNGEYHSVEMNTIRGDCLDINNGYLRGRNSYKITHYRLL